MTTKRFLALIGFLSSLIACGGDSVLTTGPTAGRGDLMFEITAATGTATLPKTGVIQYDVNTRVENRGTDSISYTMTPTFYDSSGVAIREITIAGLVASGIGKLAIKHDRSIAFDYTLSNPWAERVGIRFAYRVGQDAERVLTASLPVTHGPPIARLNEFTVTPTTVRQGESITIRWNVSHATRVQLSTWVFDPFSNLSSRMPNTDVAPVGSHTVVPLPHRSVGLLIDDWSPLSRSFTITP